MQDNLKFTITVSVILIFVGITLIGLNFMNAKRDEVFSLVNLMLSENKEESINIDIEEELEDVTDEDSSIDYQDEVIYSSEESYEYYLAKLEIPKINFSRGFYDKTSNLNSLTNNIKMLNESDYPTDSNGNIILAGHSGNYYNSYFANLWQLELGDLAYIYYQDIEYAYKIVNIYNEDKDGVVSIKRNPDVSTLTLITCTKDDESLQTIYILERI